MMTGTKDKKIRHFILIPGAVAFGILFFGSLISEILIWLVFQDRVGADVLFLMRYGFNIFCWIFLFIYCLILEKPILKSFGHAKTGGMSGNTVRNLLFGFGLGLATNGTCASIACIHGDLTFSVAGFSPVYLGIGLIAVLIQSGAEELLIRGYFMGAIESRYGAVWALVLNALLFAGLHLGNPGITVLAIVRLLCISMLYGLFVVRYKSLWMAIGMHTTWNYTQSLLLGLPNSGIVSERALLHLDSSRGGFFYDEVFGLEGSVTALIVAITLVAIVAFVPLGKKKG